MVTGLLLFGATRRINESVRMVTFSDDVVREVFDLHLLTTEYLKYHEERARAQWQLKHESLTQLFMGVNTKGSEEQTIIEGMRLSNERIEALLSQITEIHKKLGPEDVHREMDERLEGQLSIMLQALVADASKLDEASLEEIATAEKQTVNFIRIFVVALIVTSTATLLLIGRSIAIPLTRLHKGTEIIGSGNLDYKVGTDAKDEIGQLSRAFDSMTGKILDSYETLKESEEKFRSFLATANDAMILINDEGNIEYWNAAAEKIFGYPAEEVLGSDCHQLLSPMKYHEANSKGFAHFKESGEGPVLGKTLELTAMRKDGTEFPVELSVSAALLKGKWHAIGIARDITERQQAAAQLTHYREHLEELVEERTVELTKEITERKCAEEALFISEARYRSYIDATGQIGWVTNAAGEVVEDVPSLRKFTGQTYEEAKGSGWGKALHPDDLERTLLVWNNAVAAKRSYEIEYRMRRHDGVYRYFLARSFPVFMEDGRIREWVGTCIDITERKKAEEVLTEKTQRLQLATKSANLGVWDWDVVNNQMLWDDRMLELYGLTRQTFPGGVEAWQNGLHPEDRDKMVEEFQAALRGEKDWDTEFRVLHPDGTVAYIKANGIVIRNSEGTPIRVLGINQDITERKQAEEALKRIEWMLSKSPSPAIGGDQGYGDLTLLNRDGMIKDSVGKELLKEIVGDYLNLLGTSAAIYEKNGDYACGIFSSDWCQFMDLASRKLCDTDDNVTALNSGKWLCHESCWTNVSKESIATRQPVDMECNGGIHLYAVPVLAGNEVIGSINFGYGDPPKDPAKLRELAGLYRIDSDELVKQATSYDSRPSYIIDMAKSRLQASARLIGALVERKQAETKLKMTAAELERSNRELQQFAYIASHDLQEPLRKITAFGDRLVMHSAETLDEQSRDYLARMQSAAGRMKQLIEDLLDYSRVTTQAQPFAAVNLGELLGEALETLEYRVAESGGQVKLAAPLPTVHGDSSQIRQLFQNLLANALKYHQPDLPPQILVSSRQLADSLAEITVADNGIGFNEKYLDRIFLPFQRLHSREQYAGTGIGLAICQKIVQRHGGTITARSQPGAGSSFIVTLPTAATEIPSPRAVRGEG